MGNPVKTKVATKVAFSRLSGPKSVRRSMPRYISLRDRHRAVTRPHD